MIGPVAELGLLRLLAALTLVACLHVDDLAAIVRATVRAHTMREFQFFALPAQFQRSGLQVVVRPAAITPAFRMLAFW
jgi:hypothetical protein